MSTGGRGAAEVDRIVSPLRDILKQLAAGVVSSPESVVSRIGRYYRPFDSSGCTATALWVLYYADRFGVSLSPALEGLDGLPGDA